MTTSVRALVPPPVYLHEIVEVWKGGGVRPPRIPEVEVVEHVVSTNEKAKPSKLWRRPDIWERILHRLPQPQPLPVSAIKDDRPERYITPLPIDITSGELTKMVRRKDGLLEEVERLGRRETKPSERLDRLESRRLALPRLAELSTPSPRLAKLFTAEERRMIPT